jgi:hypothetical protein
MTLVILMTLMMITVMTIPMISGITWKWSMMKVQTSFLKLGGKTQKLLFKIE